MATRGYCQAEDPTPLARPNRGLHLATTPRLRRLGREYLAYRPRLEADRGAWPTPVNAIDHVDDMLAEIEGELAARELAADEVAA